MDKIKIGTLSIEEEREEDLTKNFIFNYTPRQIKEFLDQYVIKQDETKKALAIAVCDHYNNAKNDYKNKNLNYNYAKQNILILGSSGVGKTFLVKMIAKFIGVPFVRADATRFTESGYVGANVDDMIRDLVHLANGNLTLAQYGIIYFDEVDKIASSRSEGKDISGRGVQNALLKLMEESDIDLNSSHDISSQMQAFIDFQRTGKISKRVINTKNILFIASGAFSGIEDIIKKRMNARKVGLNIGQKNEQDVHDHLTTKDLIDFGMEAEFVGRLPIRSVCQNLNEEDLYHILKDSKGSILKQYTASFQDYGITLKWRDSALREIAHLAVQENTGARSLMTICEKIFRHFKFELPSTQTKELVVDRALVQNPLGKLHKLLQAQKKSSWQEFQLLIKDIERKIWEEDQLKIKISTPLQKYFFTKKKNDTYIYQYFKGLTYGLKLASSAYAPLLIEKEILKNSTAYLEKIIAKRREEHGR